MRATMPTDATARLFTLGLVAVLVVVMVWIYLP